MNPGSAMDALQAKEALGAHLSHVGDTIIKPTLDNDWKYLR